MRMPKRFFTVLHLLVICLIYASPFLIPWKWILVLAVLYFVQIKTLGGCVLTKIEFGSYHESAYWHYLNWLGLRCRKESVNIVIDYIAPPLVLFGAVLYQTFGRCLFC